MRSQFIYASILSLALLSCGRDQKTPTNDVEPNNPDIEKIDMELYQNPETGPMTTDANSPDQGFPARNEEQSPQPISLFDLFQAAGFDIDNMPSAVLLQYEPTFIDVIFEMETRSRNGENSEDLQKDSLFLKRLREAVTNAESQKMTQVPRVENTLTMDALIDQYWAKTENDQYSIDQIKNTIIGNLKDKQFLNIWDTNHTNGNKHYRFLAQKAFLELLAEAGVKNIAIEQNAIAQKLVNKYEDGSISHKIFIAALENISPVNASYLPEAEIIEYYVYAARLIDRSQALGMKVHFVDHGNYKGRFEDDHIAQYIDAFVESTIEAIEKHPTYFQGKTSMERTMMISATHEELFMQKIDRVLENLSQEKIEQIVSFEEIMGQALVSQSLLNQRLASDPSLAQRIKTLNGDDKTVIMYGAMHSTRYKGDLDATLGQKNTFNFAVFDEESSKRFFNSYVRLAHLQADFDSVQKPDASVLLKPLEID